MKRKKPFYNDISQQLIRLASRADLINRGDKVWFRYSKYPSYPQWMIVTHIRDGVVYGSSFTHGTICFTDDCVDRVEYHTSKFTKRKRHCKASRKIKHNQYRAPAGTHEFEFLLSVKRSRRAIGKLLHKRTPKRNKVNPNARKLSKLHNLYGGSVVDASCESIVRTIRKSIKPIMSVMQLHNNGLEDRRDELYPD